MVWVVGVFVGKCVEGLVWCVCFFSSTKASKQVLSFFSLIQHPERWGLLGGSGSTKSTKMHLLQG